MAADAINYRRVGFAVSDMEMNRYAASVFPISAFSESINSWLAISQETH
jgi:hypothetical protein